MKLGVYFFGKQRIVINDHTSKEEIERIKKKYLGNDNNTEKSSIDNQNLPKSKQSRRKPKRKS